MPRFSLLNKFFFFGGIAVLLTACCPTRTDLLDADQKKWQPYQKNDTIILTGASGGDTLIVKNRTKDIATATAECSGWMQEKINVTIKNQDSLTFKVDLNPKNIVFFIKDSLPRMISKFFYFNEKSKKYNDPGIVLLDHYEIKGKPYYNVLHLTDTLKNFEMYYAKGTGIIQYRLNNHSFQLN